MADFEKRLAVVRNAGAFELPAAVREFVEVAASLIRDHENRIAAMERREMARDVPIL